MNTISKHVDHETAVTRYYVNGILRKEVYGVGLVAYYDTKGNLLKCENLNVE